MVMSNLLPLDSWRQIMGYHPWHFFGLAGASAPVSSQCNTLIKRWAWQDADQVGREEIRAAIATAEQRLTSYLGFAPAPRMVTETVAWPPFYDHARWALGRSGSDGRSLTVKLREGEVRAVGSDVLTLLGTPEIAFSDADGDGLKETFVITQATTETNPDNLAVYFAAVDRLDSADAGPDWRIEPVTITIAAGTATIRGHSWLLVKPILTEGVRPGPLDATVQANYVTNLDVYVRSIDQTQQAVLTWETLPFPGCCPGQPSSTDPAAVTTAIARVGIRDATEGLVTPGPAVYNPTDGTWMGLWSTWQPPDRVTLTYRAGVSLVRGQMDPLWQTVVARLAAAELTRRPCACDAANRELYTWQADLARTSQDEVMGAISPNDLRNPFGTRRGQIAAWKQVLNFAHVTGILA
jgi:hypothetical protein